MRPLCAGRLPGASKATERPPKNTLESGLICSLFGFTVTAVPGRGAQSWPEVRANLELLECLHQPPTDPTHKHTRTHTLQETAV